MRFSFSNEEIKKLCADADYARSKLGAAMAGELKLMIASLMSATSISDLPPYGNTILEKGETTIYQMGVAGDLQLDCRADHTKHFPKANGKIDWDRVTYIQIIQISANGKQF